MSEPLMLGKLAEQLSCCTWSRASAIGRGLCARETRGTPVSVSRTPCVSLLLPGLFERESGKEGEKEGGDGESASDRECVGHPSVCLSVCLSVTVYLYLLLFAALDH